MPPIYHTKPWISPLELALELGQCRDTVVEKILLKGKCKYMRNGAGPFRIRRDWADEYVNKHTFGGSAYGKAA